MIGLLADGIHVSKNGLEVAALIVVIVFGLLAILHRR